MGNQSAQKIRKRALQALINVNHGGNVKEAAEKIGWQYQYLYRLLSNDGVITEKQAGVIEAAYGLTVGSLSIPSTPDDLRDFMLKGISLLSDEQKLEFAKGLRFAAELILNTTRPESRDK